MPKPISDELKAVLENASLITRRVNMWPDGYVTRIAITYTAHGQSFTHEEVCLRQILSVDGVWIDGVKIPPELITFGPPEEEPGAPLPPTK
jgi:hypothetical protein